MTIRYSSCMVNMDMLNAALDNLAEGGCIEHQVLSEALGKRQDHVLRDIREEWKMGRGSRSRSEINKPNQGTYIDAQGKEYPSYHLDKYHVLQLTLRYSDRVRNAVSEYFRAKDAEMLFLANTGGM